MLTRCIGLRVLSAMLCVRFAQSMAPSLDANKTGFSVSCILGGQVGDEAPRLFQIYDEGNFIEATDDTPYLQIGEHKYGKPIFARLVHPELGLGWTAKLFLLLSIEKMRYNVSVACP